VVVRQNGELVGKAPLSLSLALGGVDYHWAERRWSADCRASTTVSVRDHVPVVHGDAAKCAKMEACVVCCVWTACEGREETSFAT